MRGSEQWRRMPGETDKMRRRLVASLLFTLTIAACGTRVPDVDFCEVLKARAAFQDRKFRTEIVVVPSDHGGVAGSFRCPGIAITFSDAKFGGSPELDKL